MLTIDHIERITASEALNHPFFDSINHDISNRSRFIHSE
jgi:hypothetical protein